MSLVAVTTAVATPADASSRATISPYGLHRVSASAKTMTLDWRSVRGAKAYRVQLSKHRTMSNPKYYRFVKSSGTMRRLTPHTRYYYRVAVLNAAGSRVSSFTRRAFPSAWTRMLPGPANLTVAATTPTSVRLTWDRPSGTKLYRVMASTTPSFSSPISVRALGRTATFNGLGSGRAYYFRVNVIRPSGAALTRYSPAVRAKTPTPAVVSAPTPVVNGPSDIRVASYNVQSVSLDATKGEQRPWKQRRPGVLANILGEKLDVVGLQEANHGTTFASRLVNGTTQFQDIRNGLNAAGQHFSLANPYSANCVNASTTYHCVYQNRGVAGSDRILFNADRISMVSQGGYAYPTQDAAGTPRNLAYAVLRVNRTGDRFLFTSTHLEAHSATVRYAQWREMIAKVAQLKGSLPVVSVGDFNMQKFDSKAAVWLPAMKRAGFGDVLNQQYMVNPGVGVRAQHLVNGWINSVNHLDRNVANFGYEDAKNKIGNNIDYIFATNSLVVKEWKVALNFDPTTLKVRGIIPSDHNLVRATITLP